MIYIPHVLNVATAVTTEGQTRTSRPVVSVIVPTYNYARFIGETLESLCAQTYAAWECIVVDDGSTDDTAEVVARWIERDARIKYVWQENRRQAAARNLGLSRSAGRYVQFLDADDLIEPRKFERQVAFLDEHPDVDIVYSGVRFFDSSGGREHTVEGDGWLGRQNLSGEGRELLPALVRANTITVNSPLMRRALVTAVGPFDEDLPLAEDWDYWLSCALGGARFRFTEDEGTQALVRIHAAGSSKNLLRMYRAILLVRKKLGGVLRDPELLELNRELAAAIEGYLGIEEAVAGRRLRAVGRLVRAAALERKTRWRMKWLLCAVAAPFAPEGRLRRLVTASLSESALKLWRK